MLEIKLKDVNEKKVIKDIGLFQFWKDINNNDKMITIRMNSDSLQANHFYGDDVTGEGVFYSCGVYDFERTWLEGSSYVECDSNWEPIKHIGDIELINLKGLNYWKDGEGGLYMTMWYRLHGIKPTLIPMNIETSGPVIYPMAVDMLDEMKRLNLYKVSNMRLEEF